MNVCMYVCTHVFFQRIPTIASFCVYVFMPVCIKHVSIYEFFKKRVLVLLYGSMEYLHSDG